MVIRSEDEVMKLNTEFALAFQELQLRKKEIDNEIKELKDEYKEQGVPVSVVVKALNKIKNEAKLSDSDRLETEIITEKLSANSTIINNINVLIS